MTQRERQLLNWIEENPLISQQELADKAGITRSSVAVHISNLMKKGYITGKGYIVHTAPYVTVVGGVNMDIGGWPGEVLVMPGLQPRRGADEPGRCGPEHCPQHGPAGHGRSDADGVRRRHQRPEDRRQLRRTGDRHLPVSASCPEGRTSTYLFITDEKGDMALAVSDMEIYKHMTPQMLSQRQTLLNASQAVVLDTNIPAESIQYLVDHCTAPLFADPVVHRQGGEAEAGAWQAPHSEAQPHRSGAALRRGDHGRHQSPQGGRRAAVHRAAPGLHLSGGRRRVRRRPHRQSGAAAPAAGYHGEHHRLRRRLHGRHHLGLSTGHRPDETP